jgi:hypothetical protein
VEEFDKRAAAGSSGSVKSKLWTAEMNKAYRFWKTSASDSAARRQSTKAGHTPTPNIAIKRRAPRFIPPGRQTFDEYFAKSIGIDLSK